MDTKKAKNWLERHLWAQHEDGPVHRIVVRHVNVDGKAGSDEIWGCKIPNNEDSVTIEESEIHRILTDIEATCLEDATGIDEGLQKYRICIYLRDKGNSHGRFTFSIGINDDGNINDTGVSEPANMKGLLAQNQRHLENVMKINTATQMHMMTTLQRTNQQQNEHIENLMKEKRENFGLIEDLKSQHHERHLASLEAENRERGRADLMEKASLLVPAVVNRIAGRKLLPEGTPQADMLKGFAESLEPEQMSQIMLSLKPAQQIALVEFLKSTQKDSDNSDDKAETAASDSASDNDHDNLLKPLFGNKESK